MMRLPRSALQGLLLSALALLASCATPPEHPRDLLDETTGVHVTAVGQPLSFVRKLDQEVKPSFLTLIAIQRDENSQYSNVVLLYRWSVLFGVEKTPSPTPAGDLVITVDHREIRLKPEPHLPSGLPKPDVLAVPDTSEPAMTAYLIDIPTLQQIAGSHDLTVSLPDSPNATPFALSGDGRPSLQEFLQRLPAT